jgi:hypothetical protein
MKHLKTVAIPAKPATTAEVVDHVSCDFCGVTVLHDCFSEVKEVTLRLENGYRDAECGQGIKTLFDCCVKCWSSKVAPALQALTINQAPPRKEEWDY